MSHLKAKIAVARTRGDMHAVRVMERIEKAEKLKKEKKVKS